MKLLATKQDVDLKQEQLEAVGLRVALNSNLAGMTDREIWVYYQAMCARLALDPMSHPFDLIRGTEKKRIKQTGPSGKIAWVEEEQEVVKLYPNSGCTAQLGETRGYCYGSAQITAEESLLQLGMKVARVSIEIVAPDGRKLIGESFIDLMSGWEGKALSGNNLQNALKKACTQARRRGTLQMAGLALPSDALEVAALGTIEEMPGGDQVRFEKIEPLELEAPREAVYEPAAVMVAEDAVLVEEHRPAPQEATQEEFWEVARERGISSRDAAPLAKQAAQGETSWNVAIAALPKAGGDNA